MAVVSSRRRVFTGEHAYRVDSQRRIALPKAWRGDDPDGSAFMLVAPDLPCIHMMPRRMFDRALDRMEGELLENPAAIPAYGTSGGYAADVVCDKQGRFALSTELMEHARIDECVTLVGGFVTISIWAPDLWEEHRQTLAEGNLALRSAFTKPDNLTKAFRHAMGVQPEQ